MAGNLELAKEKYRRHAAHYDQVGAPALGAAFQREAVALLRLGAGDVVVDVGCGTGSNFPLIEAAIGETGRLIGIDLSREMLERARGRVAANGWTNVRLINASAEEAQIQAEADAVLFSFAHDVLQSPRALRNVFQHAKPGARVAACGIKWAPWWSFPLNYFIYQLAWQYQTTYEGLARPWAHLAEFVSHLDVSLRAFGTVYVASGTTPGAAQREEANRSKERSIGRGASHPGC
jgi:demethylmenaquinone methyltransferase/2-methoxy-6-polyprenyl-1,4-benzoquinol methylase